MLLFLFGSKDGLVGALLARARIDELALLKQLRTGPDEAPPGLSTVAERVWEWLSAAEH